MEHPKQDYEQEWIPLSVIYWWIKKSLAVNFSVQEILFFRCKDGWIHWKIWTDNISSETVANSITQLISTQ